MFFGTGKIELNEQFAKKYMEITSSYSSLRPELKQIAQETGKKMKGMSLSERTNLLKSRFFSSVTSIQESQNPYVLRDFQEVAKRAMTQ